MTTSKLLIEKKLNLFTIVHYQLLFLLVSAYIINLKGGYFDLHFQLFYPQKKLSVSRVTKMFPRKYSPASIGTLREKIKKHTVKSRI